LHKRANASFLPGDDCRTYGRLTDPKKPTLKIPPSKAWCRLHRVNATSPRAAHCIATSSQRIGPRIASCASQRTARMQPARAHRIANNPSTVQRAARTYNQPAAHRPQRTAHTSHLQLCTHFGWFAKVDNVFLRLGWFAKVDNRFGYEKWLQGGSIGLVSLI